MWHDTVFAGACAVLCGLLVWVAYQDLDDDQDDDLYVFGGGPSHPVPDPVPALPPVQVGPELSAGPRPDPVPGRSLPGAGSGRTHDVRPSVHGLPEVQADELIETVEADPDPFEADDEPQIADHWLRLADCESGDWIDGGADFVSGSARWDWGAPGMELPPWGTTLHHGGLQFAPSTWVWVAGDLGLLETFPHAYDAPAVVQVQVAEEVQARQGWQAWPTCGPLVGLGG